MRILSPLALTAALLCAAVPGAGAVEQPRGEWPLRPRPEVIERFDPPDSPYGVGHRGVDLVGHVGQTVHASLAGTVTFAGMLAGRGVVVVDHGDTRTTYEPVTASVTVATPVAAGAPIGTLDLAMSHCLPRSCLHWGWLRGSAYLDPLRLVGESGPIRLWPWEFTPTRPSDDPRVASRWGAHAGLLADWLAPLERWGQALGCACW